MTACVIAISLGVAATQAAIMPLDPNGTEFVTLADLLPGGNQSDGISVGDKNFSEFFYSTIGDDMPEPEDINVFGFQDGDGNYGVSFHGAFLDLPGGNLSDALLRFTVEVDPEWAARGFRISDAHLFIGGVGVGDDSFFAVDETFAENNDKLNAFTTTLGGPQESELSDWVFFDETYTSLRVTKDILAIAGDTNVPARATVIDQSFSQIPEPATIGLVALALVGIVVGKREF